MRQRPAPASTRPVEVTRVLRDREPLSHREPRDAPREHFEALFAPDLVWIGASGIRLGREEYLAATWRRYESGDHGDDAQWLVEDFEVSELADDLWEAGYLLRQGDRVTRRTTLWRHIDGQWQAVRHQGTPVTEVTR